MFWKPMKKLTEQLADWVVENPVMDHPKARELAGYAFLDTIPCIIAGRDDPATNIVRKTALQFGEGRCFVVGSEIRLAAPHAALVNAVSAHALDYDDNYLPAITHPSAVLVPALLAVADENNVTSENLIDAFIVGTEVQAQIGKFINPKHYSKGWHSTSTLGVIGCAAACAHLLKLNKEQVMNVISISVSMASGTKKQFGTLTKPYHAGMAAQNGVTAAYLARNGLDACAEPITGDWGFIDLYNQDASELAGGLFDDELTFVRVGLLPKRFPCCGSTHRTLDGILELMEEHALSADSIEKIETVVSKTNYDNLKYNQPTTESEARFSMHYCAAVLVNTGKLLLSDFTLDAVNQRPEIREWLNRVEMRKSKRLSKNPFPPHHVKIHLKNGGVLKKSVAHSKGALEKPFDAEDRKNKFDDCVSGYLNTPDRDALYDALSRVALDGVTKYFSPAA